MFQVLLLQSDRRATSKYFLPKRPKQIKRKEHLFSPFLHLPLAFHRQEIKSWTKQSGCHVWSVLSRYAFPLGAVSHFVSQRPLPSAGFPPTRSLVANRLRVPCSWVQAEDGRHVHVFTITVCFLADSCKVNILPTGVSASVSPFFHFSLFSLPPTFLLCVPRCFFSALKIFFFI